MYMVIVILLVIIIALIALIWRLQWQIKDICRQLSFLKEHESNLLICRGLDFGGIGKLADCLNELLALFRQQKIRDREKEKIIAKTYTSLSHDIRTPLTSLDGYFQLLKETKDSEAQKRYLSIISERIAFLKLMLEQLFTYSKLKNEEYRLEVSNICLNRILKDVLFSYYEDWRSMGIEPIIELTEEALYIEGNKEALQRVMHNIIKNAMEHGLKKISVYLYKQSGQVWLRIGNLAKDIEQIDVTKVFERFYKADAARSNISSGLGLSIAKEFVLRMNGTITAEFEQDMFWITISFPVPVKKDSGSL